MQKLIEIISKIEIFLFMTQSRKKRKEVIMSYERKREFIEH